MKRTKFTNIMFGVIIASLVISVSGIAGAKCGKSSCNKSSYEKSGSTKGFFQCLYDACKGCPKKSKSKTSCSKK
ncbi:MAG: hypothetical protein ISS33_04220 [Candidatus Omnitrophica bacterium]|nr:hypothetical protein [Candidatus Omnitrophota bacterium]